MTAEDLAGYTATERAPLETTYRGLRVLSMPPPSSGGMALIETLGILSARYPDGGDDQAGPQFVGVSARAGRGVQARLRRSRAVSWATPTS